MAAPLRIALLSATLALCSSLAQAATQQASTSPDDRQAMANMVALQGELRAGKQAFVERQLVLTPEQSAKFWPIFEKHQVALDGLNKRRMANILEYANAWNAGSVSDADADRLARAALAIEEDEATAMTRTYERLRGVVPAVQAARYLQIESKVRAIVRMEQAAQVPLVE